MSVLHDLIVRLDAVGDIHDRRMAGLALEELERMEAKLAAKDAALVAAQELCKHIREHVDVTLIDALMVAAVEDKIAALEAK